MKNFDYPPVDYDLCPRKGILWIIGRVCMNEGLFGAWGKCLHPTVRLNAACPPIQKYKKDLAALRKKRGK